MIRGGPDDQVPIEAVEAAIAKPLKDADLPGDPGHPPPPRTGARFVIVGECARWSSVCHTGRRRLPIAVFVLDSHRYRVPVAQRAEQPP